MDIIRVGVSSVIIGALLGACTSVRTFPDRPVSGEGGMFDMDEQTDPRLVHSEALPTIGVLRPIGSAVFLDGAAVRGPAPIPNGAHLNTGANSFARVEVAARRTRPCEIDIQNLQTGNLYSESRHCAQRIETGHALIRVPQEGTAFEVSVNAAQTRIIVLRGAVYVRPRTGTAAEVPVRANQEVDVGRSGTSTPGPARPTLDWRRRINAVIGDTGPRPSPPPDSDRAGRETVGRLLEAIEIGLRVREQQDSVRRTEEEQRDAARRAQEQQDAANRAREQQEAAHRAQERQKAAYCESYGRAAVADNNENNSKHCNFTGAAWQSSYGTHYNWCMAGDNWQKFAANEEAARKTRLAQCKPPPPPPRLN